MIFNLIIIPIVSYLIGTIPFSLIFSKIFYKKDPGKEGSRNYGALNSYEITNNKLIGLLVLLFDALKGVAAVFFSYYIIFPSLFYVLISIIFVVLGHDFNIFLKFKGGRGLATALGALLCFNPLLVIVWCCIWFLFYKIVKNDILFANSLSSVVTPVVIIFTADYVFYLLQYNFNVDILEYKIFSIVLCMIIFASHHRNIRLK